jgi:hypothetical protein
VSGRAARDGAQVAEGDHLAGLVGGPEVGVVEEERGLRPHAAPARREDRGSSASGVGTDGGGRREMMYGRTAEEEGRI